MLHAVIDSTSPLQCLVVHLFPEILKISTDVPHQGSIVMKTFKQVFLLNLKQTVFFNTSLYTYDFLGEFAFENI